MLQRLRRWLERHDPDHYTITGRDTSGATLPYLTRYHVLSTPWFRVYVHNIHRSDGDPNLHSHPWPFMAIQIAGFGYYEQRLSGVYRRRPGQVSILGRSKLHRVTLPPGKESWSVVFTLPRCQHSWFFLLGRRLISWVEFYRLKGYQIEHI